MSYSWIAVEARTGAVIDELPDLTCTSVSATIGDYTSTDVTLPIPTAPSDWERSTEPGATVLVLLDDTTDAPVWGGLILSRKRDQSDAVSMQLATLEAYFDRRYVGDAPYTNVGQNAIMADLLAKYIVVGSNGGIPFTLVNLDGNPGTLRTRTEFTDDADKTIYSVFQDLMGVDGGVEWFVSWESQYTAGVRYITPVLYVGARVGTDPLQGLMPSTTFDMIEIRNDAGELVQAGGNLLSFEYTEDWSSSGGANDVLATSTGDGDTRPQSDHEVFADADRPTFEYRFSPSTSITDVATLDQHATAELAAIENGVNSITLTAVTEVAPRLNTDWFIGDSIGFDIQTPAFPRGLSGMARCIGWELTFEADSAPEQITPTLTL